MRFTQLVPIVAFCLAISGGLSARAADIVYDNSSDPSGIDYETTDEYGDEVILGGTSRAITEIQLEIYAQFVDNGTQLARVRFYQNDGPFWHDYARTPGTSPLFEQSFALQQGYQTAVVSVPNVVVPNNFTYTVQFLGISQSSTNDRAGLLFYGVPTVGNSFDDFWELFPDGWASVLRDDVPKNNFGARILAVPGPQPALVIARVNNTIELSWPTTYTTFSLESNSDLNSNTWTPVSATKTVNGTNFEVTVPAGTGKQFFRLKSP